MKISKFQLIILGIFVVFIVAGVAVFATYKNNGTLNQLPTVTIWGTFPKSVFDQYVSNINSTAAVRLSVSYVQEPADSFTQDFIAALARGQGPDAILVGTDQLLPNEDKLTPIPYSVLPQRTFLDTYIQEGDIYVGPDGSWGIPFVIDPLVMYWNREMFNAGGIARPPVYWSDFDAATKAMTVKSKDGTVSKSAIAMGDFSNVDNARELLGSLFMQSGNPITAIGSDGTVSSALDPGRNTAQSPVPALQFFTKFINPADPDYSWNKSWPDSKTAFLAGNLATYFGFASEISDIRAKNPNLDFDVTTLPQLKSGGVAATYGRMYGFSLVKASSNTNTAYQVAATLASPQYLSDLEKTMYLPSVLRSSIAAGSSDPYISIFDKAALVASAWLDAGPSQSTQIFGSMIQAVTSGQKTPYQAARDASSQYDVILQAAQNK
ncbi:MAG: extracellular solute-binding protein [Patescibacteria group bacterium]|nr:extracellular solute-binding protein [Patescibacteria group bacterium]